MIRFIVQTDDANMAVNVGGSVHTSYRTFDVDLPELEKHLKTGGVYIERRLVGCELLSAADQPAAATDDREEFLDLLGRYWVG